MRNSGLLCSCSWLVFLIAAPSNSSSNSPTSSSSAVAVTGNEASAPASKQQHRREKQLITDKEGKSGSVINQSTSSSASPSQSTQAHAPSSRVLYISSTIDIIDRNSAPASSSPTSSSSSALSSASRSRTSATATAGTSTRTAEQEQAQVPVLISAAAETSSPPPSATFMDIKSLHPVLKSFLVGSVSGTCSTILFQPLDLVKTRLQQRPAIEAAPAPAAATAAVRYHYNGNGMITVVGHIVRDEKLSALWKGMTPALTRCVPGVGLYFASIHGLKMATGISGREPTPLESVCLGVTGRALSGVALIPFTVVKTRFESQHYQYKSMRSALSTIYTQEGYRGLTSGLLATLARDAPFSGIYLMLYTSIKRLVPAEYWNGSGGSGSGQNAAAPSVATPYIRFSCGILAGLGASVITQPADVIKTKMQLYPDRFQGLGSTTAYVYRKYGLQGYFKGLVPRMVRRTLVAAMSWTIYEQLMNSIGLK